MSTKTVTRAKSNRREVKTTGVESKVTNCRKFNKCSRTEKIEGRCSMRKCPAYKPTK